MASGNYANCLAHVLRAEGGYVDHPSDPGGATNRGITRKTLARWRQISPWWKLPKTEVRALTQREASAIYRALYWNSCACSALPAGLDLAVFDFAVNSGVVRAIKYLQAELKLAADGIFGPLTLQAVRAAETRGQTRALISGICARRLGFLGRLSTFAVFGRGWSARVKAIETAARNMRPAPEPKIQPNRRTILDILAGYKTYIVGVMMAITAIAQLAGVDLPGFDGQSSMQLLMEAFAVIFLRRGLKGDISSAG